MDQNNNEWLPHLSTEIVYEARGHELDAYLVALEGWRRGLTLRWHAKDHEKFKEMKTWFDDRPGKLFSLASESNTHYFFRTRGDLVSNEAVELASDKELTKDILLKKNVNVAKGACFNDAQTEEEIIAYTHTLGYPVVLKPTDGSFGRGVYLDIRTQAEVSEAVREIRKQDERKTIMVEPYYQGDDYRLYVIGDQVVGAIKRIPPNVIGDGTKTIAQLIAVKNEQRKTNPRLVSCLIEINSEIELYLEKSDLTLQDIPAQDQQIFLSDKCNISIGGDSFDRLDQLDEHSKETAIQAMKAIPGLYHGAVDLIKTAEHGAVVLELNPTAQIGSLLFPMDGEARDIPAALIDYYFPETKELKQKKSALYFDLYDVLEPLAASVVMSTTVSKALMGEVYGRRYLVSGDVQQVGYHQGIRKRAFEQKINGYIKSLMNGMIEVVIVGNDDETVENFAEVLIADPERSTIEEIKKESWELPVKIGFEIKADMKMRIERLKIIQDEMNEIQADVKQNEKIISKYHRSLSWKVTGPLRLIGSLTKKIRRK